jgi:hypothetical protein
MIRCKFKDADALFLLGRFVRGMLYLAIFLYLGSGWTLLVPWSTGKESSSPIHPILLGLVCWLGPYILGGFIWLIHRTFEFSWENPFNRMKQERKGTK